MEQSFLNQSQNLVSSWCLFMKNHHNVHVIQESWHGLKMPTSTFFTNFKLKTLKQEK